MNSGRRRILIVDDEPDLCEILRFAFEDQGFQVETASTAAEAAGIVAGGRFDAVLTDIRMPGGDGLTLIDSIRALDGNAPAIFIMTGFRDLAPGMTARLGVVRVLQKPFSIEEVLGAVTQGIAHHGVS